MEKVVESFWKNKKVFLTGHTGFKGSWLSLWLRKLGAEVTGYALMPANPSLFTLARIDKEITSIIGDIRDHALLEKSMHDANPDVVIHMAAQPLVRASYQDPVKTYATNVLGTVHVHDVVRQLPSVKALINVTTDKCYENKEHFQGYKENDALGGYDPYSNSKACSELVTCAFRQSFGIPVASARAGNVIGGGDWSADRLIPDLLKSFIAQKPAIVRNPQSIRPWQHVLEPLSGYLLLAYKLYSDREFATSFNFGPDENGVHNVEYVSQKLCELWGNQAQFKKQNDGGPHEASLLILNCEKAKNKLGWRPLLNLDQSLEKIVEWHKAVEENPSIARQITLQQIESFEKLCS